MNFSSLHHKEKPGIDIIGFPKGQLGIGEQTRSLARVAMAAGYKINLIDLYHPTDRIKNDDMEFQSLIGDTFKFPIRIYSITQNLAAALIYRNGINFYDSTHNIFHFAWEFSQRPTELDSILRFADEIWGISTFTSSSFQNPFGIPVKTMPNSILPLSFVRRTRDYFGLPSDKFLFSCAFDFNSYLTRKNPMAVLEAFLKAFGDDPKVGLVIKTSYSEKGNPHWASMMQQIQAHKNIHIIDTVLSKEDIYALYDSCNAYISLHRSEGFGLGIAENMLLEKPVICTGYSGNMDFCSPETSFIVDFSLVKVPDGDYPFSKDCLWAEPAIDSAVKQMRYVIENQNESALLAKKGKKVIVDHFSPTALSHKFNALMESFVVKNPILVKNKPN